MMDTRCALYQNTKTSHQHARRLPNTRIDIIEIIINFYPIKEPFCHNQQKGTKLSHQVQLTLRSELLKNFFLDGFYINRFRNCSKNLKTFMKGDLVKQVNYVWPVDAKRQNLKKRKCKVTIKNIVFQGI